ncbi:hypothetical protein ACFF45_35110, partial [Streptomyces cinereospinus]
GAADPGGTAGGSNGTAGDPAGAAAGAGGSGTGGSSADPAQTDPAQQNVARSGGFTPAEALGLVRWVLLGVLVAGGVAGLAGPAMVWLSGRRAAGTG